MSNHTRNNDSIQKYKSSKPFFMVHNDVGGPLNVRNVSRACWFVSLIEKHTRLTWIFLMKEKAEVAKILKNKISVCSKISFIKKKSKF